MHIVIGLVGLILTVYFFVARARNAAHVASDVVDMAKDVRLAARRFGFKRQTNIHPVETIEEPKLAVAAIATAFMEMDDLPTKDQREALKNGLRGQLGLDADGAQEATILGHWFVSECGSPDQAVPRLSRKLYKLNGTASFEPLLELIKSTVAPDSNGLNRKQQDALEEIRRAFRISN